MTMIKGDQTEYRFLLDIDTDNLEEDINELGMQGFELDTFKIETDPETRTTYHAIMSRYIGTAEWESNELEEKENDTKVGGR